MLVTTCAQFKEVTKDWQGPIACDTETAHDSELLGVSLAAKGTEGIYIPLVQFDKPTQLFILQADADLIRTLQSFFAISELIGHNFTYDKRFIDAFFGLETRWIADTRIMWHLSSAPAGPRPYGLKDAQKELLGWEDSNNTELELNVKKYGGSLRKGEHYKADLEVLGKYAALDAKATIGVFYALKGFFDNYDYWGMLTQMMQYNLLLERNTKEGILVDVPGLERAHKRLVERKEAAKKRFLKQVGSAIAELEEDWKHLHIGKLSRLSAIELYKNSPQRWEKFNLNSDKHKRELFYKKLGNTPMYFTDGGLPKVDEDSIKQFKGDWVKAYLTYEKANTLSTNFSGPYLSSAKNGRLHPGFNICGTVSYRLSGFKPYLLNAPFDEKLILKHFHCDPGNVGVHADLAAIEPTITAHYSNDPYLYKVFGEGRGDIYLDLALALFPNDKELQSGYDPDIPITEVVKKRFSRQRKVSKVIQLAVQYTGTGHTVARNLTKDGIPTAIAEADSYVRRYWQRFNRVRLWNEALFLQYRQAGALRNAIGRIIRVPDPTYKDLPNRFIQSSAHDVLVLWVLQIYRMCQERGINVKPILLDCHDSTSNQCPAHQVGELKKVYLEALHLVNAQLELSVQAKCEIKTFTTLAGLKGDD